MKLQVIIDRFEGDKAVLVTDDNNTIVWPKEKLPKEAREGSNLVINILSSKEAQKNNSEQAKAILNEILDTEEK